MRILIAAEDPQDRRTIKNRLHEIGFCPAASFARGRETLVYIQHHRVDLLIATRNLQDMEGPALARALELQGERNLPVLMICRQIRRGELLEALDQGVDNVLLAPFSRSDLKEKISGLSARVSPVRTGSGDGIVFGEGPENVSVPLSDGHELQPH